MKRFYVVFLMACLLAFALSYFSIWWSFAGLALVMVYIAYEYYAVRLRSEKTRNDALEQQIETLQLHLDNSIVKEQKTYKESEKVKQSKQQLLTVLNHEIRTPMNGVMGMTLLLSDTSLTKEQQEYADTIRKCGESLLTTVNDILVNDILDFSKLDQEERRLEYKNFDLRDCVEEVLEMFAAKAGKANLDLMYYIDKDMPEQIIGDRKRLRQVLINLVENAMKFTWKGEIFVNIFTSNNTTANYRELNFEVRDTGIGIEEGQLRKLFNGIPGKDAKKDKETEGTGLGLVVCKKLVELMGGRIEVKSQYGKGSTFSFSIPLTPSLKVIQNGNGNNPLAQLENKRVLVVDDNLNHLTLLMKQLKSWKMLPESADSGKQALDTLAEDAGFDLILTDMNMQGMDGIELAGAIRKQYPGMPVILMNYEQYKDEYGLFTSVLTKPIRQYALRDHLIAAFTGTDSNDNTASKLSEEFSKRYPLRILVAEDNLVNQKLAMKILGKLGYEADLAKNGKEVVEMIGNQQYDIILMDVQMPEMDGLEATRMIRTCAEVQPVIIAVTANVMSGDRDDCIQAGMDDYISKPIELPELLKQLEKWAPVVKARRK